MENNNQPEEMSWTEGIVLEVMDDTGALGTPLWLSIRDKPRLTKQIHMATVFHSHVDALAYLAALDTVAVGVMPNQTMSPMVRTYNKVRHSNFWDSFHKGQKDGLEDYSYYLTESRMLLEKVEKAILNGPSELVTPLARELHISVINLEIAVDRHMTKTMAQ